MVPLYILGLLTRYGPQHGYQIRKIIAESLADFTQIKLPTIYYHLTKMAENGLLSAESAKTGARPEKTVYSLTDKGAKAYRGMLSKLFAEKYRPAFDNDAIFYFSDHSETNDLVAYLKTYAEELSAALQVIGRHRQETLHHVPDDAKIMVDILFSHHESHYKTELAWSEETLRKLNEKEKNPC